MIRTSWLIEAVNVKPRLSALFGSLLLLVLSGAQASEPTCLRCHDASSNSPVHAIFQTRHGQLEGGGVAACISCHGDSSEHAASPTRDAPTSSFGPRWALPSDKANGVCLGCHQQDQMFWVGSIHEQEEVACTDCHNSHRQRDAVLVRGGELDTCLGCHTRQQAELRLPSRHPILEGQTACTVCHDPHGTTTESALRQPTLNDNCYSCHDDKRGPHLWEHPPVAEDCSTCHKPHGSVHASLLTTRGPFLCQQCHSAAFHPSVQYDGRSTTSGSSNQYVLGKNCLNCHSQVHGSNHPSGARLAR
jgi:DmsE family decaheme c-type cytochrome